MIEKQTFNKDVHKIALYTAIIAAIIFVPIFSLFLLYSFYFSNNHVLVRDDIFFLLYIFFYLISFLLLKKLNFNKKSSIIILFSVEVLEITVPGLTLILHPHTTFLELLVGFSNYIMCNFFFCMPSFIIMICCIILFSKKDSGLKNASNSQELNKPSQIKQWSFKKYIQKLTLYITIIKSILIDTWYLIVLFDFIISPINNHALLIILFLIFIDISSILILRKLHISHQKYLVVLLMQFFEIIIPKLMFLITGNNFIMFAITQSNIIFYYMYFIPSIIIMICCIILFFAKDKNLKV